MKDTTKSSILRFFVVGALLIAILIGVAIADEIINRLSIRWTGNSRKDQVEITVFVFWLVSRLFDWAERRIWIGSAAPSPSPQKTEG